jgi:predicted AlkP superfamily pyrophosphatase or phosphodiesterase
MKMKKMKKLGVLMVLAISYLTACQKPAEEKVKKALFVIVDGIPADVVERVQTPWIDSIAAIGGYTRAYTGGEKGQYNESPTISAVCYAHLMTGTWTHKHNVWDNSLQAVNYHYPSAYTYYKNQYPEAEIGIFSTWEDNRTKLMGEGLPQTGGLTFDYVRDGYELDSIAFPRDPKGEYFLTIDDHVAEEGAKVILEHAPGLSWVYLQYTDNVGHQYGDSEEMDEAVRRADAQVGVLWQAIQEREKKHGEEWLIYVVTDHGRDDRGFHHGKQSERERTIWFSTNDRHWNAYAKQATPGLVDVMPSVLRFLEVDVPKEQRYEWDGIPLNGPVSHRILHASLEDDSLKLEWEVYDPTLQAEVWIATTNAYAIGGKDTYHALGQVAVEAGKASFSIADYPSDFYKIVLETTSNSSSRWVKMPE